MIKYLPIILIAGAAIGIYLPALNNGFVFDDQPLIADNELLRDLRHIPQFFLRPTFNFYRPLRSLSFLIDRLFWGPNPWGYHLTNLLLHSLCCIVFYQLLGVWKVKPWPRIAASLIFLVHPIHVEAVDYLSSRAELLGTFFALLFFLTATRYLKSGKPVFVLSSLFCLLLALFSKESFAVVPLIFIFVKPLALTPSRESPGIKRRFLLLTAGGLFLSSLFVILRLFYLKVETDISQFGLLLSYPQILLKIPSVLLTYFRLWFFPIQLSPHHPLAVTPLLASTAFFLNLSFLAAILVLLLSLKKFSPLGFRGALWLILGLLPVANFYPLPWILAEKYLYFPSLGFCLLWAGFWSGAASFSRFGKTAKLLSLWPLIIFFSVLTLLRHPVWRSNYSLWSKTSRQKPPSPLVLYNWGISLIEAGKTEEGLNALQQAEKILPRQPLILERVADAYELLGRYPLALQFYQQALERDPDSGLLRLKIGFNYDRRGYSELAARYYQEALLRPPQALNLYRRLDLLGVYQKLARWQESQGNLERAALYLNNALKIFPQNPELFYHLGRVYQGGNNVKGAMKAYHQTLRLKPDFSPAYFDLGMLLAAAGEYRLAESAFHSALRHQPDEYRAHTNLGNLYYVQGRYRPAIREYELSLSITDNYKAHYNLGFIFLDKLNQPDLALPHLQKAQKLATDPGHKRKLQDALSRIRTEEITPLTPFPTLTESK